MIFYKNGFSLAELLLALAIISIIAVMGFSVTKKSTEKAYNLYIYNGYNAIQHAITDATTRNYNYEDCKNGHLSGEETTCKFIKHIKKLLSEEDLSTENPNFAIFRTLNNIKYTITFLGNDMLIKMSTPTGKKKINKDNPTLINSYTFSFLYNPENAGYLIPYATEEYSGTNEATPSDTPTNHIKLQDRIDLLPFYIDDGIVGRIKTFYDQSTEILTPAPNEYKKRQYSSFREAFCKVYGTNDNVNCSDITRDPNYENQAIIRVANPRKVF